MPSREQQVSPADRRLRAEEGEMKIWVGLAVMLWGLAEGSARAQTYTSAATKSVVAQGGAAGLGVFVVRRQWTE
jgi:hypothetical protein